MKLKDWLYQLFYFNKQERNGVFVLSLIIIVLIAIKLAMPFFIGNKEPSQFIQFEKTHEKPFLENKNNSFVAKENPITEKQVSAEYFVFDPNTVSVEDAEKLGFSKKLAATLQHFRDKGGRFFTTKDLKKLYGMSSHLFENIEPYVLIPQENKTVKTFKKWDNTNYVAHDNYKSYPKKTKEVLELNSADSTAIVYLKGIGPAFTKRIIKYRTLLGGFYSINQLHEVYGMTDSLFATITPQITIDKNAITRIPINSIDFNSLRKHPYFNYASAQAIINYKFKHGRLTQEDLKNLGVFSEEKLQALLPYISY